MKSIVLKNIHFKKGEKYMNIDIPLWFILGILILPAIIYYTVKAAVKEGIFNALKEYDKYKNQKYEHND